MFLMKRILMSAVDAGGGSGSNPAPANPPAETPANMPQAQGAAITMTKEQFDASIASAAAKAVADAKDSIFAEARRTFTAPNKAKTKLDGEVPSGPVALSASEERTFLRGLDRTLAQLGLKPNSSQYARVERDLLAERPDNVETWVKEQFEGFGVAPASLTPAQPAQPVAPAQPQNARPASSHGAPPAPQVPLEEIDLWTASESDRAAFIKTKGIKAYNDKLRQQGKGRPVSFR